MKAFRLSTLSLIVVATLGTSGTRAAEKPVKPKKAKPGFTVSSGRDLAAAGQAQQSADFFNQYLLAEMASQLGEPQAVKSIYELASRYRDARLAKRAAETAFRADDKDTARAATLLWLELEPNAGVAQQVLARLAGNDLDATRQSFARWLSIPERVSVLLTQLPVVLSRFPDKPAALAAIKELTRPHLQVAAAHYAMAHGALAAGMSEEALVNVNDALRLKSDWGLAAILKAQILRGEGKLEHDVRAVEYLKGFLDTYPEAHNVRQVYARLLVAIKNFALARDQFRALDNAAKQRNANDVAGDVEAAYAAALLSQQIGDHTDARTMLLRTLDLKPRDSNPVFFNLGLANEALGDFPGALSWLQRVGDGDYFITAKFRAANILVKQEGLEAGRRSLQQAREFFDAADPMAIQLILAEAQLLREAKAFPEAYALLDEAVSKNPDAPDLLYDRAMLAERLDLLDVLERDLKRVIELKPDYAHAYNALGYTFADRNKRLDEALRLIEKAIELSPNDPSIRDSLAWVHFRLGRIEEALTLLQQIYKVRPDAEIAAHLGEVLWVAGRQAEAHELLDKALQASPDSEPLILLKRRLKP